MSYPNRDTTKIGIFSEKRSNAATIFAQVWKGEDYSSPYTIGIFGGDS